MTEAQKVRKWLRWSKRTLLIMLAVYVLVLAVVAGLLYALVPGDIWDTLYQVYGQGEAPPE